MLGYLMMALFKIQKSAVIFIFTLVLISSVLPLSSNKSKLISREQDDLLNHWTFINVNNWIYWQNYEGRSVAISTCKYPKNTAGAIYSDGLIWLGYKHLNSDSVRHLNLGGNALRVNATRPGWIIKNDSSGQGINPVSLDDPRVRIYRIMKDLSTVTVEDMINEAAIYHKIDADSVDMRQAEAIYNKYITDWKEWPGNLGAPYYDRNRNGRWDPTVDEPGIQDADQIIWYTINDLDSVRTRSSIDSNPMGLELQCTVWAYKYPEIFTGQLIFKRYRLINKSNSIIDSMYIGQFADIDIGYRGNDFAGCDTVWQYGYCYNAEPTDEAYALYNELPPAVAYFWLQGPIVYAPGAQAIQNFKLLNNYRNLGLSSFGVIPPNFEYQDVPFVYHTKLSYYNWLLGFRPCFSGQKPYIVGAGEGAGQVTKFPLSGNPVTRQGDIDGHGNNYSPGERQLLMASGPFSIAPGASQEIIIAIMGSRGVDPYDNLAPVKYIQQSAGMISQINQSMISFVEPEGPYEYNIPEIFGKRDQSVLRGYSVSNNYPNPFNSSTTVNYNVNEETDLSADIYNLLGQKVRTIKLGVKTAGSYKFTWNARDDEGAVLPSGLYILNVTDGKTDDLQKLILIK